jgi:hypothetical protein
MGRKSTYSARPGPGAGLRRGTDAERQRRRYAQAKVDRASLPVPVPAPSRSIVDGQAIRHCFQRAAERSPRLNLPSPEGCDAFANFVSEQANRLDDSDDSEFRGAKISIQRTLKYLRESAPRERIRAFYEFQRDRGTPDSENSYFFQLNRFSDVERSLAGLLDLYETLWPRASDWRLLARIIHSEGMVLWQEAGFTPNSLDADGPLGTFVRSVLLLLEVEQSKHAVSAVLRGRRGPPAAKVDLHQVTNLDQWPAAGGTWSPEAMRVWMDNLRALLERIHGLPLGSLTDKAAPAGPEAA